MVKVQGFPEQSDASRLHSEGLDFELAKNFRAAHKKFDQARSMLLPEGINSGDYLAPSAMLQVARVDRDDAFTFGRESMRGKSAEKLSQAFSMMRGSEQSTKDLVEMGILNFSHEAWAKLMSEHGATIGTLFRLSVINKVVLDGVADDTPVDAYKDDAWHFLLRGSDYYYAASHAMNVARYERIIGNGDAVARWLGRAACTAAGALRQDKANAWNASRTVAARLPQLRSKRAARASVISRP